MRNQDNGGSRLFLRNLQNVKNLRLNRYVKSSSRLVGNDDVRVIGNSDGNHHALTHAAGEFMWIGVQALFRIGDTDNLKKLKATIVNIGLWHVRIMSQKGLSKLIADGKHGSQGRQRILENHGNPCAAKL